MFVSISNFPGYLVTDTGDVISLRHGWRPLKLRQHNGYLYVGLYREGKQHQQLVHRLVAEAFLGPNLGQVNHRNGIKTDNLVENLEYVSAQQNIHHAWGTGLARPHKAENSPNRKLTWEQVRQIRAYKGSKTMKELAELFGVSPNHVSDLWRNKHFME